MISLAGKAALITGGSRGIGAAAVKLFAQAGADVVFSYHSAKEAAKHVEQEAGKHGTRVEGFKADGGKHLDNKKLVEHTIARLGAAWTFWSRMQGSGTWRTCRSKDERKTVGRTWIRINLKSVYSVIHFAVPQMIKQKSGKIIPISSTAAQRGESFHTHYGGIKGWNCQFDERPGDGIGAPRDSGEQRCAGMGGDGYVQPGAGDEGREENGGGSDSAGACSYGGRGSGTDPVSSVGPGELHGGRNRERERGLGAVRIGRATTGLLLALLMAVLAPASRAQHAEYMDPDLSAEKAKKILQQLVTALGGQRFLQMKSSVCEGRYAQFGHNGDTSGYVQVKIFRSYPDNTRIEYGKKATSSTCTRESRAGRWTRAEFPRIGRGR